MPSCRLSVIDVSLTLVTLDDKLRGDVITYSNIAVSKSLCVVFFGC